MRISQHHHDTPTPSSSIPIQTQPPHRPAAYPLTSSAYTQERSPMRIISFLSKFSWRSPSRWPSPIYTRLTLTLFVALILWQCSPPPGIDMSFNRQTFVDDWRDEIIYQIVVDRFSDGDPH